MYMGMRNLKSLARAISAVRPLIAGGSGKRKKHRYPLSCIFGIAEIGFIESRNRYSFGFCEGGEGL